MNTSSSCLSNEKSSSENFSYNSSQGMSLDVHDNKKWKKAWKKKKKRG